MTWDWDSIGTGMDRHGQRWLDKNIKKSIRSRTRLGLKFRVGTRLDWNSTGTRLATGTGGGVVVEGGWGVEKVTGGRLEGELGLGLGLEPGTRNSIGTGTWDRIDKKEKKT